MIPLAQTLLDGLVLGGVYAFAAVGFSLIFGVLGVVNLTHGVFVVLGAYAALLLHEGLGIDPLLGLPVVMAGLFALGYAYQRTLIAAAVERASLVASLLVTFGVALMARNLLQIGVSPDVRSISTAYSFAGLSLGPLRIDLVRLAGLATSLVLLSGLSVLLARSAFGRAIRATAQQPVGAAISGVNVRHVHGLTFGLGNSGAEREGRGGVMIWLQHGHFIEF